MNTPALDQLMRAYFHEDWNYEGTEDEVVHHFFRDEPDSVLRVAEEIDQVLDAYPEESQTASYIWDLRPGYNPVAKFGGYRAWLECIAQRARASQA